MTILSPPAVSFFDFLKEKHHIFYFIAGFIFGKMFFVSTNNMLLQIIAMMIFIFLVLLLSWAILNFAPPKVEVKEQKLFIKQDSFEQSEIETITYKSRENDEDDVLTIKVKGFESKEIFIDEPYFRKELKLAKFIENNFFPVTVLK